ncbi:MAG: TetR/AcrR family transcriptional regulator [Clostridium sp.]
MDRSLSSNNTKSLLGIALKKYMSVKPLEKITIQEIVDECNLNRRTFYYHFQDIYQLLEWVYKEDTLNKLEINNSYNTWQEGLIYLFNYIEKEGEVYLCAFKSLGRPHLEKFMYSVTYRVTREIIDEITPDLIVENKYKDFVAHYYALSLVGIVINWLQEGMKERPVDITKLVLITVQGSMKPALERFSKLDS